MRGARTHTHAHTHHACTQWGYSAGEMTVVALAAFGGHSDVPVKVMYVPIFSN